MTPADGAGQQLPPGDRTGGTEAQAQGSLARKWPRGSPSEDSIQTMQSPALWPSDFFQPHFLPKPLRFPQSWAKLRRPHLLLQASLEEGRLGVGGKSGHCKDWRASRGQLPNP